MSTNAALEEAKSLTAAWGENFANTEATAGTLAGELRDFVNNAFGEGSEKAQQFGAKITEALNAQDAKGALAGVFREIQNDLEMTSTKAYQFGEALKNIIRNNGNIKPDQINILCDAIDRVVASKVRLERQDKKNANAEKEYQNAIKKTQQGMASTITKIASAAMSAVQLNNSIKSIVSAFQSGEDAGAKFMAILSALPAIMNLVKLTTEAAAWISSAHTAAKTGETVATEAYTAATIGATGATSSFYAVLWPLLIILAAVIAAMVIFNSITEANKKAQEDEAKAMNAVNDAAQKRIQKQKEEREELQKSMSTWLQYENARKEGEEVSDDWVEATESVLEALDKEEWKVYLVTKRYGELAEKIKEANAERTETDLKAAKENYKQVSTAMTALGNDLTQDEIKDLGLNTADFNKVKVQNGKTTFEWGRNDLRENVNKIRKQNGQSEFSEDEIDAMLQEVGFGQSGPGDRDITFQGRDAAAFMRGKKSWEQLKANFLDRYGINLSGTNFGIGWDTYMEKYVDPIVTAYENMQEAAVASHLQTKYPETDFLNNKLMIEKQLKTKLFLG